MGHIGRLVAIIIVAFAFGNHTMPAEQTIADEASPELLAAGLQIDRSACDKYARCDRTTGCVAPTRPDHAATYVLPGDTVHNQYVRDLEAFRSCRQRSQSLRTAVASDIQSIISVSARLDAFAYADIIRRWNGAFLWAPASASADTITRFGDEARAVFGQIPEGDCSDEHAIILPLQVDGNVVNLKPNPNKEGHPLEFEHRDTAGKLVKWTSGIAQCDKPSLAGSAPYCGLNSRLSRVKRDNVEWLFFCRKSSASSEVSPTPYWQRSNPKFSLLGIIGFNRQTGETVFFDGRKDRGEFDWTQKFPPPGGASYADSEGRKAAEALYDPTFQIECSACHDNKSAFVITPSIQQARVGFAGDPDPATAGFSLDSLLPATPRKRSSPFRVIGSAYTGAHRVSLERARIVSDPTGNCTECHTLTTQVTGQRLAADAVAKEPVITRPDRARFLRLRAEQRKLREIDAHRTTWATRVGNGKIHPWMVPIEGNHLSSLAPEISSGDWRVLSNCLWGMGGAECNYGPLYTPCPPPGAPEQGDRSEPVDFSIETLPATPETLLVDRILRLSWKYLNRYGGVPQRDDVRFNIAVRSAEIPVSRDDPFGRDFPDLEEARDGPLVADDVAVSGATTFIRNISYFGHARFTDPAPSTEPRLFQLDLPVTCNRRYLVRLLPKRFCFDQGVIGYGRTDYLHYADVPCH